ncbi:MAG: protein kinase domain-containing protein [Gemmatimonadales bacterium]
MADTLEHLQALLRATYRVERLLGSGGMATVYLAHDLKHDRPVAIKVLRHELAIELGRERFLREIRIAASLNHPHILPLHDSGEAVLHGTDGAAAQSWLYYVMPYVEGETLLDLITHEKRLHIGDAVRITREVASALGYAHARGVIHRDIKPANILLSGGYALVADFGLARAITSARASSAITRGGLTMGTPAYMSPEQASGDSEIDGRSDIYSLGCVLYEMLAGDPPFVASNPAGVLARHAAATAMPVRTLRPAVPAAVDAAVTRALQKTPADRFQNADAFGAALRDDADTAPRGPRRARGHRVGILTGLAALLAAIIGLAVTRDWRVTGGTASAPAEAAMLVATRALDGWDLDGADTALTQAIVLDSTYARAAVWLAATRNWAGGSSRRWRTLLEVAQRHAGGLDGRTAVVARALRAESDSAWDRACSEWRGLTRSGGDFAVWFGLANCLAGDHAIVPDRHSPSGWRFRASADEMVTAYRHAFEHLRPSPAAIATGRFNIVRDRFFVRSDQLREGWTVPGGAPMLAAAGWAGDSLVFVPFAADSVMSGASGILSRPQAEAIIRQRRALLDVASSWLAADPGSPGALEAVANVLLLLGDRAAIDSLRRARTLARDSTDKIRLGAAELWYQLTMAVPDDSIGLRQMRALADSLLRRPDAAHADLLQGVAALTGRTAVAAQLGGEVGLSADAPALPAIAQDGPALLVYSAMGGPPDSIRRLERSVASAIEKAALAGERLRLAEAWMGRAARIAWPDERFAGLRQLGPGRDGLLIAEAAFDDGHPQAARDYIAMRRRSPAESSPPEAVFAEARLLLATGDTAAAVGWLDRMFAVMPMLDPQTLSRVSNAAALVRAMALRADLAAGADDSLAAARWARPVVILWSGSDGFLQPIVRRMARLAAVPLPQSRRP